MEEIAAQTRIIARHGFADVPGVMIRTETIRGQRYAVVKLDGDAYTRKLPASLVRRAEVSA